MKEILKHLAEEHLYTVYSFMFIAATDLVSKQNEGYTKAKYCKPRIELVVTRFFCSHSPEILNNSKLNNFVPSYFIHQ